METIEYRNVDKSAWPRGPWDAEPDKKQWQDEATGLPCLIVRNERIGHLCGYVGVTREHPAYGKHDDLDGVLSAHGGVNFFGQCTHTQGRPNQICHVPSAGEPDDVWWIGFDAGHAWDLTLIPEIPRFRAAGSTLMQEPDEVYRDFAYMENECRELAAQLKAMEVAP